MRGLLRGRSLRWVGLGLLGLVLIAAIDNDDEPRPAAPAVVTVEAQESAPIEPPEIVLPSNTIPNAVDAIDDAQRLARANRPAAARRRLADIPADAMTNQRIRRRATSTLAFIADVRTYLEADAAERRGKLAIAARGFASIPGFRDSARRSTAVRQLIAARNRPAEPAAPAPAPAPAPSSSCDPNYAGACVPRYPPDVNCADVGVTVTVVGSDPHRLDGDGDGYGCE